LSANTEAWTHALYTELRAVARRYLHREGPGHTLQTTALVHEAYLRLYAESPKLWPGRADFLAAASQVMRHILIDYARTRLRGKRGGDLLRITLDELRMAVVHRDQIDILAVDQALNRLEQLDARQARIVEMRFFAGMSLEEIAEVLGVASKTVSRDWAMARAWLRRELDPAPEQARTHP
jgi:RNA polymerase sigma-70 factor (ECF subfamily)